MSDKWEIYHADIEGETAYICFDDGISEAIDDLHVPNLVKLQVAVHSTALNGMASEAELQALEAVEEEIASWADDTAGAYVGRVTVGGYRTFFCYTAEDEDAAEALAGHLAMQSGHEIGMKVEVDPAKDTYWNALYPAADERQSTNDMHVITQLKAYNDNLNASRRIDHFAYFDSHVQTEMFANWARKNGFLIDQMTSPNADTTRQHMIVFHHDCRPLPEEISTHTAQVAANANRLGGEYAGWTTIAQA